MDLSIILILFVLLVIREYTAYDERQAHTLERQALLDRLMARSLPEYKDNAATEPNQLDPKPDPDIEDLESVKEQLLEEDHGTL